MPLILSLFLFIAGLAEAKDFGCYGHTFEIGEEDLLDYIKQRLELASEAELQKIHTMKEKHMETIQSPPGRKLPLAREYRSYTYDPSITLKKDLFDQYGRVIAKKGTTYNPLQHVAVQEELLFIDGTNEQQLNWAKTISGKWILTNGNPIEIENKEERPVYFDQTGYFIQKLGIKAIPARAFQDGMLVKIEEIPIGECS